MTEMLPTPSLFSRLYRAALTWASARIPFVSKELALRDDVCSLIVLFDHFHERSTGAAALLERAQRFSPWTFEGLLLKTWLIRSLGVPLDFPPARSGRARPEFARLIAALESGQALPVEPSLVGALADCFNYYRAEGLLLWPHPAVSAHEERLSLERESPGASRSKAKSL